MNAAFIVLGLVALAAAPFAPPILRLRIRVLRFLHWRWLADLHENHFDGFVLAARIILTAGGLVLVILGLTVSDL